MAQYIDKSALVAEIEKLKFAANTEADIASTGECFNEDIANAKYKLCEHILGVINSIEVKEVDLEKEILNYIGDEASCKHGKWTWYECNKMIRYFFELGLKAQKGE